MQRSFKSHSKEEAACFRNATISVRSISTYSTRTELTNLSLLKRFQIIHNTVAKEALKFGSEARVLK
jgi:hypothetical protein